MKKVFLIIFYCFSLLSGNLLARPINHVKDLDLKTFALKYKGTIDGHLYVSMFLNEADDKLSGIYFYDNNKYYLRLEGTINKTRNTIIYESNYKGKITGRFEGVLDNNNFKGTWKNADNTKELTFVLVNQAPLQTGDNGPAPIVKSKTGYVIIYLALGALVLIAGVFFLRRNKPKSNSLENQPKEPTTTNNNIDIEKLSKKIVEDLKDSNILVSKEAPVMDQNVLNKKKGDDFEIFVIEKFSNKYFKCKSWRGDKMAPSHFPESNKYPDLELEFNYKDYNRKIAVECKYRSNFSGGCVDLGSYDKLQQYKVFERENGIQVYVVLGVGGEPTAPEELYLIPLPHIESNKMYRNKLSKEYTKSLSAKFFYDAANHCLT